MAKKKKTKKKSSENCVELTSLDDESVLAHANYLWDKIRSRYHVETEETIELIRIIIRGPYTIAGINEAYWGVTKFNPKDWNYSPCLGASHAIRRAVVDALGLSEYEPCDVSELCDIYK